MNEFGSYADIRCTRTKHRHIRHNECKNTKSIIICRNQIFDNNNKICIWSNFKNAVGVYIVRCALPLRILLNSCTMYVIKQSGTRHHIAGGQFRWLRIVLCSVDCINWKWCSPVYSICACAMPERYGDCCWYENMRYTRMPIHLYLIKTCVNDPNWY